jgi:hypothetical protein
MRFIADGVDIPDELLWAQDEGRVVFFCGAGVSMAKANLPNFSSLTQNVMEHLGVPPDNDARRLYAAAQRIEAQEKIEGLAAADRVFGQLRRTFDDRSIGKAVSECLVTDENVDLSAHRAILKLARLQTGETRLVTTNFDLLFEKAGKRIKSSTRSSLPHIEFNDADWGVVHLHGMVKPDYSGPTEDGFVLSSAEFGDAYLSLGWARDFVRKILERYVAVFIGYSADDPPVRYLLEGLQQTKGLPNRAYAFQSVPDDAAVAAWDEKGVEAITFPINREAGYDTMWQTLEAWAERSRNPQRWRKGILTRAKKGPRALEPHERGTVAHIVSSAPGALAFSRVSPPLPSEWLCVFDPHVRYGEPAPESGRYAEGPVVDPHVRYKLDSDLPQRDKDHRSPREGRVPDKAWNALEPRAKDLEGLERHQVAYLRGHYARRVPVLPARTLYLASWIAQVANQPACAWWAGQQPALHPDILDRVRVDREEIGRSHVQRAVSGCWRTIREYHALIGEDRDRVHDLKLRAKASGWHEQLAREYVSYFSPRLKLSGISRRPVPPTGRGKITERDLVHVEVEYPNGTLTIEIPDDYLIPLIGKLRQALELASDLEKRYSYEMDISSIEPDVREPDEGDDRFSRHYKLSGHVLHFVGLFRRLAQLHPDEALKELRSWRREASIFRRLRVWAFGNLEIADASEFAAELLAIADDAFWPFKGNRDLLLGLSKRWHEFSEKERKALVKRIAKGPKKPRKETGERHSEYAAFQILNRLHWLSDQGCELYLDLHQKTAELQQRAPEWKPEYSKRAARSHDGGGGSVRVETAFDDIDDLKPEEVIPHILAMERRPVARLIEFDPFLGLSTDKPDQALRALDASYSADGEFHAGFWRSFLRMDIRKDDTSAFTAQIARSLLKLSDPHFADVALAASDWLENQGTSVKAEDAPLFESVWKKFLSALTTVEAANESALVRENETVDWATEAINSPAGNLAEFLAMNPGKERFEANEAMPQEWKDKAEQLLVLPGDSRRFALVIFGYSLGFLYYVDPQWTEKHLLSVIDPPYEEKADSEALWAGFFWRANVPTTQLFARIKPNIVELLEGQDASRSHHLEVLAGILLAGWGERDGNGERLVLNKELRHFLIQGGSEFRQNVLWTLDRWSKEEPWPSMVPEFLRDVWPKQKNIRTKEISSRLVDLALSQGDHFPEVARLVTDLVSKVDDQRIFVPELRNSEKTVAAQYPDETLDLLYAVLAENEHLWPYGARDAIEVIGQVKPALRSHQKFIELQSRQG